MKTNDLLSEQALGENSEVQIAQRQLADNLEEKARIRRARTRIPARLLFLGVTGLAALSAIAADPPELASRPQQAVVFDGSIQANSVSLVGFTVNGILVEIQRLVTCEEPVLPSRIVRATLPEPGLTVVADIPAMHGYEIPPLGPGPLPVPLEDDCDVLAAFRDLDSWIQSVFSTADILLENAVNCHAGHVLTHCQIVKAVAGATLLSGNTPVPWGPWIAPTPQSPGFSFVPHCEKALRTLYRLQGQLNSLAYWTAQCNAVGLPATLQQALARIVNNGGLTQPEKEALINQADNQLAMSQFFLGKAQFSFGLLQALKDQLTFDAIQAACDECSGSARTAKTASAENDSVRNSKGSSIKERLLRDFAQALHGESDREDAQRLRSLIHRISKTPERHIAHVAYPSASAISEFHIALSPQCETGDRKGPSIVVLEALNSEARLPEMSVEDEARLLRAFGLFANTLKLHPPDPVFPPDPIYPPDPVRPR
jgi:hypothetical protein